MFFRLQALWNSTEVPTERKRSISEVSGLRTHFRKQYTEYKLGKLERTGLGPQGPLGQADENRLVKHMQRLGAAGFAPNKQTVRELDYRLAKSWVSVTNVRTKKTWRVTLGLLHSLNEIQKFPLGRPRDCHWREHKESTLIISFSIISRAGTSLSVVPRQRYTVFLCPQLESAQLSQNFITINKNLFQTLWRKPLAS
jgi:hypothetical protein